MSGTQGSPGSPPCAIVLIRILLIISGRNSSQVRLDKIKASSEGKQNYRASGNRDWNIIRTSVFHLSFCVSASFSPTPYWLLSFGGEYDCCSPRLTSSLLRLPLIAFQKVPEKDSDWLTWGGVPIPGSHLTPVVRAGRDRAQEPKVEAGEGCSRHTKQLDDFMALWYGENCITLDHRCSEPLGVRIWVTS